MKRFEDLLGKTITNIEKTYDEYDRLDLVELVFVLSDGIKYQLCHRQDCCEFVRVEDINGNLNDLLDSPLTMAEVVSSNDFRRCSNGSCTWTFYKLATVKGYVTIRWIGESNGCYSEEVDFVML